MKNIDSLVKQCTTQWPGGNGQFVIQFDEEKFARLIIEECANIADVETKNPAGCGYITKTKGMNIREHFGI